MNERYGVGARVSGGIVGGILAGIVMALLAMIRASTLGLGFWLPMKLVAAVFWGVVAIVGGGGVILVGILTHLAVAGGAGMLFGLAVGGRMNALVAAFIGVIWGVVIWLVNTWAILPWLNPVMLERQMVAPGWWLVYHFVFGFMLFLVPSFVRAFGRASSSPATARPTAA